MWPRREPDSVCQVSCCLPPGVPRTTATASPQVMLLQAANQTNLLMFECN